MAKEKEYTGHFTLGATTPTFDLESAPEQYSDYSAITEEIIHKATQQFTGNILFDEKIGGSFHMALGAGYPETGSKNKSAIHWDMICDMRKDAEILVDGELFYKNGQFVFEK